MTDVRDELRDLAREEMLNPREVLGDGELRWGQAKDASYQGDHPAPRFFFTDEEEDDFGGRRMTLNLGPQHPATHGTLRVVLQVQGERIVAADTEIGFLHTGFEKLAEHMSFQQWVTVTDRMNYMSAINNNIGYAVACEELFGLEPPRRAQVLRVILGEFGRLADHIVCCGLAGMDVGAFSLMLWAFQRREMVYDLMEAVTGTRLTTSYTRIGGLFRDVPDDFPQLVHTLLDDFTRFLDEMRGMTYGNRIFEDRLRGTGVIPSDEAISWGLTGPILRASGVNYDIRKARPYSGYDRYEFDVPTQTEGDSFARYVQRIEECEQSLRIIRQAMEDLPDGPVNLDNKKIVLPEKAEVYQNIESLIHHFKQIMFGHGLIPPRGAEVYSSTESPNGELGFYLVSSGEMESYKTRVRPPSIFHFAVFPRLVERPMISDAVAVLATLNVIAGELGPLTNDSPAMAPETREFSEKGQRHVEWLFTRYPERVAALLPVLRLAEEEFGDIDDGAVLLVARTVGVSPGYVWGVLTFYTHYRRAGDGTYCVQVCSTISCALRGCREIQHHLEETLGISAGETTPDGRITLKKVECLGSCDTAPVVQINETYHENVSTESIDAILAGLE